MVTDTANRMIVAVAGRLCNLTCRDPSWLGDMRSLTWNFPSIFCSSEYKEFKDLCKTSCQEPILCHRMRLFFPALWHFSTRPTGKDTVPLGLQKSNSEQKWTETSKSNDRHGASQKFLQSDITVEPFTSYRNRKKEVWGEGEISAWGKPMKLWSRIYRLSLGEIESHFMLALRLYGRLM